MTRNQTINQLIILREAAHDAHKRKALEDAILLMRSTTDYYIKAYMRGYHDAKLKGDEA